MSRVIDSCEVHLWGRQIGAAYWDADKAHAAFEYAPDFLPSGIELAPLRMPLADRIYRFPELRRTSFRGLPGLLADSLPDDFGNAIIDQWLLREGRDRAGFSPIERLCYIGRRGMGALEYRPAVRAAPRASVPVDIAALTELAQQVLDQRRGLKVRLDDDPDALDAILRVGTSAGGARAKAVIAWNPDTQEIRSGQVAAPDGFEYWLLKFDGVTNREHGLEDPQGYGRIEYAYSLMARAAGIDMSDCQLLEENGRAHFMTRRFDRDAAGNKQHMQSLYAIDHLDNELAGAHSYEQAFDALYRLQIPASAAVQLYRRMCFNVVARNQDDHTKNIAFLMNKAGEWSLAPAFDVIYAWNPDGEWTSRHQMTINGKRDGFEAEDLFAVAKRFRVQRAAAELEAIEAAVKRWPEFAAEAGVPENTVAAIAATHRQLLR